MGLDLMPKGMQNMAVLLGHEGLGSGSDPCLDLVLVHVSGPGLEPNMFSVSLPLSVPGPKDEHRVGNLAMECPVVVGFAHVSSAIFCSSDLSSSSGWDIFFSENIIFALGAVALGERLCSLPELSESGTPLVRSVYKQTFKYYRRAKGGRGTPVKDSFLLEAVVGSLRASPV